VDAQPPVPTRSDALSRSELRRRASAGLFVLTSQSVVNLVLAFAGNIVLARLLLPRDFGLVAIGLTVMTFAQAISDGGLGSGLIRRPLAPSREELRTVLAFQLAMTAALGLLAAALAANFESGLLVAVMMLALPLAAFQTPGRVVLDRQLRYERLAVADLAGVAAHYAWAITGVVAGYGVWALGTATIVRPLVTSALVLHLSGVGFLRPSLAAAASIRSLFGFGVRFQGVSFAIVCRDQGLNAVTGAIGGVSTLGLWSFANRLMQMPMLFFQALWRVSFPAMSQLLAAKHDPAPLIQRSIALSATTSALMLSTFAAAVPELVPAVFGEAWREAGAVMTWACFALLVGGPVSVSTVGYLYAVNRPGAVLRAAGLYAAVWIGVAAALLPSVGVAAVGVGWLAGSFVDALVLGLAARRLSGAAIVRPLAAPLIIGALSGLAGLAASTRVDGVLAAGAGAGVALALCATGLFLVNRALFLETLGTIIGSIRAATTQRRAAEPESQPAAT
jgi:O-antigen/teichoic acid export membrane protein